MVVVQDEGSRFDGSIETVWRFMNMPEAHGRAHKTTRNSQVKAIGGTTMMVSMERQWRGNWVKVANRVTILPPLGLVTEFMEGPLAGTKTFTVYTPENDRQTRVDVYGDFKSPILGLDEIEKVARSWLETSFNEDAPAIRLLQTGQLDESAIGSEAEQHDMSNPIPESASEKEDEEEKGEGKGEQGAANAGK
jgi:hypothetical protein